MSNIQEQIMLAITKLTVKKNFLGAVTAPLRKVFIDDNHELAAHISTAGVDGESMFFNLGFCAKLAFDELYGLVWHEAEHVALLHPFRRNGRDGQIWNIACDAVINYDIWREGGKLPEGGVRFDWVDAGMSAEEVYLHLLTDKQDELERGDGGEDEGDDGDPAEQDGAGEGQDDKGNGKRVGGWGRDVMDAPPQASEAEAASRIASAARMAKMAGDNSLAAQRVLDGALTPKIRWQDVLRNFMVNAIDHADYTWKRGNRRYLADNIYLPSMHSEAMGRLVIGVDTSGSISSEILNQVAGELSSIVADCRPSRIDVVYCDYNVSNVESFTPDDQIELHPKGGGGTRFKPVFDWVDSNRDEPPVALIFFTDTWGNMDELVEPDYPVLWGLVEANTNPVPFGISVEVY